MTPRLSGHFSIFGLVFFVPNSLLGIARQWSREKFVILTLSLGVILEFLIYGTWAILLHISVLFAVQNLARFRGSCVNERRISAS